MIFIWDDNLRTHYFLASMGGTSATMAASPRASRCRGHGMAWRPGSPRKNWNFWGRHQLGRSSGIWVIRKMTLKYPSRIWETTFQCLYSDHIDFHLYALFTIHSMFRLEPFSCGRSNLTQKGSELHSGWSSPIRPEDRYCMVLTISCSITTSVWYCGGNTPTNKKNEVWI